MSDENKGEGNVEADKQYRKGATKTAQEKDTEKLAREAEPKDEEEAEELAKSEEIGESKAKEKDPNVKRDY